MKRKTSCRRLTGGCSWSHTWRGEKATGMGRSWAAMLSPQRPQVIPQGFWSWVVLQRCSPLYLTLTCPCMQADPGRECNFGQSRWHPFSRWQFLERNVTESLQQPTLPAALVLKGGSGQCTPSPPHSVCRFYYLHFHLQRTMFFKQWLEHLSKAKGKKEKHSLSTNMRGPSSQGIFGKWC